jgi:hypothetical protein
MALGLLVEAVFTRHNIYLKKTHDTENSITLKANCHCPMIHCGHHSYAVTSLGLSHMPSRC